MSFTLNPILSNQPGNPNIGYTYSWLGVENDAGRPLYAQAFYLVNAGDIATGGGGGGGTTVVTNTVGVSGGVNVTNTVGVSGNVSLTNASSALNASVLGLAGFVFTDDAVQVNGAFSTVQVISATRFSGLTATNSTVGNLTNYELPQGFVLNGPITNYKLAYGAVLAYKL